MEEPRKVIIGPVRLSYANVWEPRANQDGKEKYSASLIIPKSSVKDLEAIEKAIDAAIKDGIERGKLPRGIKKGQLKLPLRDGDEERNDEAYEDAYFINANSNRRPQIIDGAKNPIFDQEEVYSGCWANVSITFYAYDVSGNKGIAAGLGNIQKVKHDNDDALGGAAAKASDEFTAITEEEDDFLN